MMLTEYEHINRPCIITCSPCPTALKVLSLQGESAWHTWPTVGAC